MDNRTFQTILFKVGEKFLNYILNFQGKILDDRRFGDDRMISDLYGFNQNQIECLYILNKYIQECDFLSSQNPHTTIKQYLFNNGNLFNDMRRGCGGYVEKRESDNKLLDYLLSKGSEYYPSLLISNIPTFNPFFDDNIAHNNRFWQSRSESELVFSLLKNDSSLSKLLHCPNNDYLSTTIQCQFENIVIISYVFNFIGDFLLSSFQNCCYRTRYSLNDFLNDIECSYYSLAASADKKNIEFSYFAGIYGLRLDGVDEFELSKNVVIRNINELSNPCARNTTSIGSNQTHKKAIIGCVLEYKATTKSLGKHVLTNETRSFTLDDTFKHNFQSATLLALQTIQPPFSFTFFTNSIPLSSTNPIHSNNNMGMSIFSLDQLIQIKEWYEILEKIDLKHVNLTIHRIKSAIYNREYHVDSILDAFIAWESMFSSDISTTKSVTQSIRKMLNRVNYEISSKKINDLYGLRSSIVHGNPIEHKLIKSKDSHNPLHEQEKIKEQVIYIALITLKELVKDKELIDKTPRQRVEYLLNPTTEVCDKCSGKKYKIE